MNIMKKYNINFNINKFYTRLNAFLLGFMKHDWSINDFLLIAAKMCTAVNLETNCKLN